MAVASVCGFLLWGCGPGGSAAPSPGATATADASTSAVGSDVTGRPVSSGPGSTSPGPTPAAGPTAAAAASPSAAGAAKAVAGVAYAVAGITDGDTIKVRVGGTTERVRLIGLDAPELKGGECWSQKAASKMQSLVQSRSVHLVRDPSQADRDRYGRLLRHVSTTDGRLVAEVLIAGGFARELTYDGAYDHQGAYRAAEERAKAKKLGIWSAACAEPPVVAAPRPTMTSAVPVKPAGGCVIKGNINREGEKIYHVPGGGSYEQTVITESKGERWFCSEQAARDAGWRKARN